LKRSPTSKSLAKLHDELEAMMLIKSLKPQIVLTDFNIRPTGRIFAKQIKSQHPKTKVLGVTELKGRYVKNFVKIFVPMSFWTAMTWEPS
jgi:DNA-binding NarL/FixJ family response regulator